MTGRYRRTSAELADVSAAIIAAVEQDKPVTLRGVYYRVVSAGAIEKTESGYKVIMRELVKLRRSGAVSYADITDGTRWISKPKTYDDLDEMLDAAAASYRRALWNDQDVDVHLYSEKDAISGVIWPITARYDVPLGVLRGYVSETFAWSVAQSLDDDRPTFIYNLGDHDPSGVDAWRSFTEKVGQFAPDADVTFTRLAVTPGQIEGMRLPTRPTKSSDSRASGFRGGSVEVDAIPAPALRELVAEAIEQHIDPDALRLTRMAEDNERRLLLAMRGTAGL